VPGIICEKPPTPPGLGHRAPPACAEFSPPQRVATPFSPSIPAKLTYSEFSIEEVVIEELRLAACAFLVFVCTPPAIEFPQRAAAGGAQGCGQTKVSKES